MARYRITQGGRQCPLYQVIRVGDFFIRNGIKHQVTKRNKEYIYTRIIEVLEDPKEEAEEIPNQSQDVPPQSTYVDLDPPPSPDSIPEEILNASLREELQDRKHEDIFNQSTKALQVTKLINIK